MPEGGSLAWVWGVRRRALFHPRPLVLSGVRPGPTTHWLWVRGVRAWGPVTNPAGTFEWKVLSMGVKAGPQAFQRLVSWYAGRLKPHIRAYIGDILVGTRPTCTGKGKLLNSQAIMEHYTLVRELFEVLKECHLQVKK